MSLADINSAIRGALDPVLDALGVSIADENKHFTPGSKVPWAQVNFVPNSPSVDTLGTEGKDLVDGFTQVGITYPTNSGSDQAFIDFEGIRAVFPAGARLSNGGQEVVVKNCGRSQGRQVTGGYRVDTTIYWYALIPR